jgi:hypothetical protein
MIRYVLRVSGTLHSTDKLLCARLFPICAVQAPLDGCFCFVQVPCPSSNPLSNTMDLFSYLFKKFNVRISTSPQSENFNRRRCGIKLRPKRVFRFAIAFRSATPKVRRAPGPLAPGPDAAQRPDLAARSGMGKRQDLESEQVLC